jgi:hypothetical protein
VARTDGGVNTLNTCALYHTLPHSTNIIMVILSRSRTDCAGATCSLAARSRSPHAPAPTFWNLVFVRRQSQYCHGVDLGPVALHQRWLHEVGGLHQS